MADLTVSSIKEVEFRRFHHNRMDLIASVITIMGFLVYIIFTGFGKAISEITVKLKTSRNNLNLKKTFKTT